MMSQINIIKRTVKQNYGCVIYIGAEEMQTLGIVPGDKVIMTIGKVKE
jgi:hypothetical protein